ncbi:hypothetical protein Ahia01_000676000 [Argonauta hians]
MFWEDSNMFSLTNEILSRVITSDIDTIKACAAFVIYCLSCGAQAYTAAELDAVCTKAAAVQPHPYRCDAFLSCVPTHTGFKAVEMACPSKLMFDPIYSVCNWAVQVTCDQECTDGDKFKAFYACDTYFECKNNKFNPKEKKCAPGESFDAATKTCVTDASCGEQIISVCMTSSFVENHIVSNVLRLKFFLQRESTTASLSKRDKSLSEIQLFVGSPSLCSGFKAEISVDISGTSVPWKTL